MKERPIELWREVFEAADRALDLDPADRHAFVARCLDDNPEVGAELKSLLDTADVESTLESPAAAFAESFLDGDGAAAEREANSTNGAAHCEFGGDASIFGPYRVLREVGWGGMGAVYLAERSDDQYRKRVALKVLPRWSGGDGRRLQRFREERQILATLDHPGIARLLDGGVTSDGVAWFAMEYIDGEQIDRYCDRRGLTVEERLKLFCDVCAAVQYAHRNLVVHRDLKPSNILVSGDGRVALLDFGIAKLLAEEASTGEVAKTTGDRLMTPLYASPEQIRGEHVSTAADVYGLGVLLHVVLTGTNPYRLSTFEGYEVARAVLEQDPERPSVSALRAGASTAAGGAHAAREGDATSRRTAPAWLVRRLRGDLDAIVLKALAKEPSRRYATVEQFETDIRRHLTGLPVLARPESRLYHAGKFLRRHRIGAGITAAAAVLVLSFATVMTVQRSRIRAQAERIALERDRAEQLGRNFLALFQNVAPGQRELTSREILDSAAAHIDKQLAAHPDQRARLMFDMARAYHRLELHDRARGLLEVSLALRRNLRPKRDLEIAETLNLLGAVHLAQGNVTSADAAYSEALALRRGELGVRHGDVARTLVGLSAVRRAQRRLPEAEQLSREAVTIDQSRGATARADLAASTSALATAIAEKGDHRAAAALLQRALMLMRQTHPEEDPEVAATMFDLAAAFHGAGDHRAADSLTRYALGLHRRLLTGARLTGIASVPVSAGHDAPEEVNAIVKRAFAERPAAVLQPASASSSLIAFVSDRDGPDAVGNLGNLEIYVMNPDGTGHRRLTHVRARDGAPAFSPDGSKIAFTSQRAGGFDIFVMNADGTDQRRLTNFTALGLGAVRPSWSPDGKRIAFNSRVNGMDIYVINLDGTALRKLTDDPAGAFFAAWSPDGQRIAFSTRRHGPPEIYLMSVDGSNQVRLTFNKASDQLPAWSPDGRRIAFHSDRDGDQEIYVMNADGSNQIRLTTNRGEDAHPSWSPDGRQIVFHRRVLGHAQVYVMNADGTDVKRLTDLSSVVFNGFPTWGPVRK